MQAVDRWNVVEVNKMRVHECRDEIIIERKPAAEVTS